MPDLLWLRLLLTSALGLSILGVTRVAAGANPPSDDIGTLLSRIITSDRMYLNSGLGEHCCTSCVNFEILATPRASQMQATEV